MAGGAGVRSGAPGGVLRGPATGDQQEEPVLSIGKQRRRAALALALASAPGLTGLTGLTASGLGGLGLTGTAGLISLGVIGGAGIAQGSAVPDVTAGPALYEQAPLVTAPVVGVTVYSDRARVTRSGHVDLAPGVRAVRLPDLPGGLQLASLRVSAEGAEVLRVEANPVERPVRAIEGIEPLVLAVEATQDAIAQLDAQRDAWVGELGFLATVSPKALPEDEEQTTAVPAVDPAAWSVVRQFLASRRQVAITALAALAEKRRELVKQVETQQAELGRYGDEAFTTVRRVEVVALLQVSKARPEVSVDYFVGGASWRPAYAVELGRAAKGGGEQVTLRSAAAVQQATGEDWDEVVLSLSTARPGQGIEAPELLTWTLGEAKDFLPVPRAEAGPRPPVFPGPAPTRAVADALREARLSTLRTRIDQALSAVAQWDDDAQADAIGAGSLSGRTTTVVVGHVGLGLSGTGRGGGGYGAGVSNRRPAPQPSAPPPPPMPMPVMVEKAEAYDAAPPEAPAAYDFEDDAVDGNLQKPEAAYVTALSSIPANRRFPGSVGVRGGADDMPTPGSSSLGGMGPGGPASSGLRLFDDDTRREAPLADPSLPANLAGGLDYTFRAQTRATVPSSPKVLTVPLSADVFPVTTLYAASPGVRPVAYLKATVTNTRAVPILAGPVDIFVGADYVGTGKLQTTGASGALDLPLGADEDLRIERRVLPNTVTEGVFGKEEITRYVTEIDVANDKRRAVRIRIAEQFPLDGFNEDVTVKRGKLEPKPIEGPDDTGRMVFELDIPPGETRTVRFEYRIRRPENWQLQQH